MALRKVSSREYNNIKSIFNALDTEKDGELTFEEFSKNLIKTFKLTLINKEMEMLLQQTDMNKDGLI